jgi:5,10-methylenetetrahydromethanopterin reductase
MKFGGEVGIKFALQSAPQLSLPDLIGLAQRANGEGFAQLWVNDNLGQRNIFVVLGAIAASVPIRIGTAIVVPYFRNPVDIADSLAALSELTSGRELSVGIARGEAARAGRQVEMPSPLAVVRETVTALKALLAGETIRFRDYPVSGAYHHIRLEQEFRLAFPPSAPVHFYGGGYGPRILKIAGETMHGIYCGDHFVPLARAGRVAPLLAIARSAASAEAKTLADICEIDIAIARDRGRALEFARPFAAQVLLHLEEMGFTADNYRGLGLEPALIAKLRDARRRGATIDAVSTLLSDEEVKACFVAGDAEECRDQLAEVTSEAERLGFTQIALAKLGPDYDEAISLLLGSVGSI